MIDACMTRLQVWLPKGKALQVCSADTRAETRDNAFLLSLRLRVLTPRRGQSFVSEETKLRNR